MLYEYYLFGSRNISYFFWDGKLKKVNYNGKSTWLILLWITSKFCHFSHLILCMRLLVKYINDEQLESTDLFLSKLNIILIAHD